MYLEVNDAYAFVSVTTPFEQIKKNFRKHIPLESKLKDELKKILTNPLLESDITEEARKDLQYYMDNQLIYFNNNQYFNDDLQHLFFAINSYQYYTARNYFLLKKRLLDQMSILEKNV